MDLRDVTFNSAQKWTVICIEYWIQRTNIIESVVTPYMQDKIWVSNSAVLASGCAWVELSTGIVCVGVCAGVIVPADSPCDICTVYLPTLSQYYFLIRLSRLNNACNVTGRNLCMRPFEGSGGLLMRGSQTIPLPMIAVFVYWPRKLVCHHRIAYVIIYYDYIPPT